MEKEPILQLLGFTVNNGAAGPDRETLLYYNGPDGTIRWLWPAHSRKPLFLKFYHQAGWRSRMFSFAVRTIFWLGIQQHIFNRVTVIRKSERFTGTQWAAFTGTPGPNRKMVVYQARKNDSWFHKIPVGENASPVLRNEAAALQRLQTMNERNFFVPLVEKGESNTLCVSDISKGGESASEFSSAHALMLKQLRDHTLSYSFLKSLPVWEDTCKRLRQLERNSDSRIPPALLRKLGMMIQNFPAEYVVETSLAHGDFTPWNMYQHAEGSLSVFDWELSRPSMPFGFDAFHFIIQNGILTQRSSWKELEQEISVKLFNSNGLFGNYSPAQQRNYLTLYLIINTVYYLNIYAQQPEWHRQVYWLLETWSLALSSIASSSFSHRMLMLMDLADHLHGKTYAALKYGNHFPEELPEGSDLDLCMPKPVYSRLHAFFNRHPLISYRNQTVQSFMVNDMLVFNDGSTLSADCIWKLKRKNLVMMPLQPVFETARTTRFGITVASPAETARFVGLFYALNQTEIPARYRDLQTTLPLNTSLDRKLRLYYRNQIASHSISNEIKNLPDNSGIRKLVNIIAYGADVIRRLRNRTAPVVTFSGVDGAGKSTVIENLRTRIEKQLRKPVVVLRHRPSLFPILSAYTKGKVAAERAAAESLPRQGKNTSLLSSLVRFGYYYLDYLIGQWYVWFRYSVRGHVVLYDRYYFDFIHDSRRSNIDLPSGMIRWLYALIRKPDINFFLFASPEIIRARKQELDVPTIQQLTEQYRTFFQQLGKHDADKYVTVENTDLAMTMKIIMGRVTRLAA
ncbi:MAG: phosphotransferase [Cyclobacteriaceae bacterium]